MRKCQLNYSIINIFSVQNKLCGGEESNLSKEKNLLEIKDLNNNKSNNNTSKNEKINKIILEKYDNENQTNYNKQEENIETNGQDFINTSKDNIQEKKEENNMNNNVDNNLNKNNLNNESDNLVKINKNNDSKKEIIINKEVGKNFSFNIKSSEVSLHNENLSKRSSKKKIDTHIDYDTFNNKMNEYKERVSFKKENGNKFTKNGK